MTKFPTKACIDIKVPSIHHHLQPNPNQLGHDFVSSRVCIVCLAGYTIASRFLFSVVIIVGVWIISAAAVCLGFSTPTWIPYAFFFSRVLPVKVARVCLL